MKEKLKNSEENLIAAAENLFHVSQDFNFHQNSNMSEQTQMICKKNEKICEAFDFQVKFVNSKIEKVVDGNGNLMTMTTEKLQIVGQKTIFLPSNIAEFFLI